MDYKQSDQQSKNLDFFTVGNGTNNPEINNFEAENNLDLSNNQVDWRNESPNSKQEIGGKIINISKNIPQNNPESFKQLGQIVETEPQGKASAAQISAEAISRTPYNKEVIKTSESLSKEGIQELDAVVKKFENDGNAADFYDVAREMVETNLSNSYNRTLGEEK